MALIIKTGSTYSPVNGYGLDLTGNTYYGVIDHIEYDKKDRNCSFFVEVYASQSARVNDNSPVDRIHFNYYNEIFDEVIGRDGLSVPQAYTLAILDDRMDAWESDEK